MITTQADRDRFIARETTIKNKISSLEKAVVSVTTVEIPDAIKEAELDRKIWLYNQDTVTYYEKEVELINSNYIASPIIEQDIVDYTHQTGRLFDPTYVDLSVLRIPQFDGSPIANKPDYELARYLPIREVLNWLDTGLKTNHSASMTSIGTNIPVTPIGSTIIVSTQFNNLTLNAEAVIGNSFIGRVLSVVSDTTNPIPPEVPVTSYNYTILVLSPFSSPLINPLVEQSWVGFTNTERTNKSATKQTLMNNLLSLLTSRLQLWQPYLTNAISSFNLNPDEKKDTAYLDLLTLHSNRLSAYMLQTDISNTGLTFIRTLLTDRETSANNRITAITLTDIRNKRYYWSTKYAKTLQDRDAIISSKSTFTTRLANAKTELAEHLENTAGL